MRFHDVPRQFKPIVNLQKFYQTGGRTSEEQ